MKKSIFVSIFAFGFALACFFSLAPLQAEAADADWSTRESSTTKEFTDISCPEARTCYLVSGIYLSGGSGAIIKTDDGGDTFTVLKSPTLNPLHSISCPTASTCYSAGDFGTFLKTTDGGETWSESMLGSRSSPPRLTNVFAIDEQRVMVVGQDGAFYNTADGGASWGRPSLRSVADLKGLYFSDSVTGFIAGTDGTFWKSSDGGASWEYVKSLRDKGAISGLSGLGKEAIFALGDTFNKSADSGNTWTQVTAGAAKSYQAVAFTNATAGYLIADKNLIFKTVDSGATWQLDATVSNTLLSGIACPSASYCIVVGSSGKILRLGTPPAIALLPSTPPLSPPAPAPLPVSVSAQTPALIVPVASTTGAVEVSVAPVVTVPITRIDAPSVAETIKTAVATVFNRTLKKGASGNDVQTLQEILAGVGGVYPEGEITGYFGAATAKAVGLFQEKHDLAKPGEAGYGQAGPKTRAKLIETLQGKAEEGRTIGAQATSQTTPSVFYRSLKKGASGNDVKKLQELLSADKEIYPEGEVTGYFGPATKKAVGKFQEKYDLANPGESGYGDVGPKTRAKLKELSL